MIDWSVATGLGRRFINKWDVFLLLTSARLRESTSSPKEQFREPINVCRFRVLLQVTRLHRGAEAGPPAAEAERHKWVYACV